MYWHKMNYKMNYTPVEYKLEAIPGGFDLDLLMELLLLGGQIAF